jgi:F-type H+-transporting ATPase subunit gamma
MANVKELRGRIKSIGNIAKITKAMEMVASMKLRKVQNRAQTLATYTKELNAIGAHLVRALRDVDHPLFRERELKRTGVLLVTSDRGLCGSYNANVLSVFRGFVDQLKTEDPNRGLKLYVYGRKGSGWLRRRGFQVDRFFAEPSLEQAGFSDARVIAEEMVEDFVGGEVDEVWLVWTEFVSAARFTPRATKFIPLRVGGAESHRQAFAKPDRDQVPNADYLLEPDVPTLFERLVPRYLETVVYDVMLSSFASEMASRRMAMKGATDAATRMGRELKRVYNRARQESITKELLDIVGGANAVG